jgi:exodeoxyribonuclease-3
VARTPCTHSRTLSRLTGAEVFLKLENLQFTSSFKERGALNKLLQLGLHDGFRLHNDEAGTFSWWDYRAAGFRRNLGLRIDLTLVSDALKGTAVASGIDREPRTWERPSDHAPAWVELG